MCKFVALPFFVATTFEQILAGPCCCTLCSGRLTGGFTHSTTEPTCSDAETEAQSERSSHPAHLQLRDEENKHACTWKFIIIIFNLHSCIVQSVDLLNIVPGLLPNLEQVKNDQSTLLYNSK